MSHQKLLTSFKVHQIDYELHTHEAIFTAEQGEKLQLNIKGPNCKNLFLRDKRKTYFLVSTLSDKRVDLKALSKNHGNGHFSFGNPGELLGLLGVTPGSVTPFGLINDTDHQVTFLLDKDLMEHDVVNFHPLRNDMTVSVPRSHFLTFFEKLGRKAQIVDIPEVA
jgi:Ala-tRNA(Pro) deacylase